MDGAGGGQGERARSGVVRSFGQQLPPEGFDKSSIGCHSE